MISLRTRRDEAGTNSMRVRRRIYQTVLFGPELPAEPLFHVVISKLRGLIHAEQNQYQRTISKSQVTCRSF